LSSKRNELIPRNVKESELKSCQTSGTTSTPLTFYHSKMEIPWYLASETRGYGWAGWRTGDKVIYLKLFEPHSEEASANQRLQRIIRRWNLLGGYGLSEQSMEKFCRKKRNLRSDFVQGGAGPVNIFASFLLKHPEFTIRPKAVFTYAETLLPHYRRTIEEAFNCKVHDFYGSTEVPNAAFQCGCHEALHVTDENVLLEIEKGGEAAAAGEEGKVLLTSLNALGTPFIRYDVGDSGRILDDDCPCGRNLSLFKPVGRRYEYFVHSDGSFTFFRDWKTVFEGLPIEDFQIVQQGIDEIVINVVKGKGYTEAHTDFISKHARAYTSSRVKVRVKFVYMMPLIGFGKVPHFVKLPTEYT
jgi:phenylacetate-CoA ligase